MPIIQILKMNMNQNENGFDVKRLKYKGFILTNKSPNNLVILENGILFTVTKITCSRTDQQNVHIEGHQWKTKRSIFKYPTKSEDLQMWELARLPSRRIIRCDISKILNAK